MNLKFKANSSKYLQYYKLKISARNLLLLGAFCFSFFICACSVPNLEKPECTASRQTVKEFYSYHFGNDMKPSKENLENRAKFLTSELKSDLESQTETTRDYFTETEDYPKAFRIGSCEVTGTDKTVFQVVLFWRKDEQNSQREIKVETVKQNHQWLINRIF